MRRRLSCPIFSTTPAPLPETSMKDSLGTRKRTMVIGLAVVLTLLGSTSCGRNPTGVDENEQVCYLIDGQVYCFPSSES